MECPVTWKGFCIFWKTFHQCEDKDMYHFGTHMCICGEEKGRN